MKISNWVYFSLYLCSCILLGIITPYVYFGARASLFGVFGGSSSIGEKMLGVTLVGGYFFLIGVLTKLFARKMQLRFLYMLFTGIIIILSTVYFLRLEYLNSKNIHPHQTEWEKIIVSYRDRLNGSLLNGKYWFNTGASGNFTEHANILNNTVKICFAFIVKNIEDIGQNDCDYLIQKLPQINFDYIIIIEQDQSISQQVHKAVYARYTKSKQLKEFGIVNSIDEINKYKELDKAILVAGE